MVRSASADRRREPYEGGNPYLVPMAHIPFYLSLSDDELDELRVARKDLEDFAAGRRMFVRLGCPH